MSDNSAQTPKPPSTESHIKLLVGIAILMGLMFGMMVVIILHET